MYGKRAVPALLSAASFLLFASLLCILAAGCAVTPETSGIAAVHPVAIRGTVHGGEQPVVGAQVYLYAAGTSGAAGTGYGANAVSLLNAPGYVVTGSDGSFALTGDYDLNACQAAQDLVYLVAVGGNSGGTGNNPSAVLMSALGNCANLNSGTFVMVNEVTTVASVYALQQFMNATAGNYNVGTSSTNVTGLKNAFLAVTNLVKSSTGTALTTTPNGNGAVPQAKIDTLANILAACVNSAGGSSVCNNLFANATPPAGAAPTDTLHAILDIAQNPANSVAALYLMQLPEVPFAPPLTGAPNDWTLAVKYTGGGIAQGNWTDLAVDASGNVWAANGGSVGEFSTLGASLQGSNGITSLEAPTGIAIDPSGNVWVSGQSMVELSGTGSQLSAVSTSNCQDAYLAADASGNVYAAGANGYLCKFVGDSDISNVSWPATDSFPAVDSAGHVWVANIPMFGGGFTIGEFNPSLSFVSDEPSTGWSDSVADYPFAVAIDALGNAWAANASGSALVTELTSGGTVISGNGYAISGTSSAIAVDGNNTVWTANTNGSLSHLAHGGTPISPSAGYHAPGATHEESMALDASGNIWTTDQNGYLVEWVGLAAPVATPLVQNLVNNPATVGMRP